MKSYTSVCPKCEKPIQISSSCGGLRKGDPCGECWQNGLHKTIKEILAKAEGSIPLTTLVEKLKEKGYEWEKPLNMMKISPDYLRPILKRMPEVEEVEIVSLKDWTSPPGIPFPV